MYPDGLLEVVTFSDYCNPLESAGALKDVFGFGWIGR